MITHDFAYRIKRSADYEAKMKELRDKKIFEGYRDILMASAVVGVANNAYKKVDNPAQDGVLMQFFKDFDRDIMDLIAFVHEKSQKILSSGDGADKNKKYEIFESYANGGFPILLQILDTEGDDRNTILSKYYASLVTGVKANEDVL